MFYLSLSYCRVIINISLRIEKGFENHMKVKTEQVKKCHLG